MGNLSKHDKEIIRRGAWSNNPRVPEHLQPVSIVKDGRLMYDRLDKPTAKAKWEALSGEDHNYLMKDVAGNIVAAKTAKENTNPLWWDSVQAPYAILKNDSNQEKEPAEPASDSSSSNAPRM